MNKKKPIHPQFSSYSSHFLRFSLENFTKVAYYHGYHVYKISKDSSDIYRRYGIFSLCCHILQFPFTSENLSTVNSASVKFVILIIRFSFIKQWIFAQTWWKLVRNHVLMWWMPDKIFIALLEYLGPPNANLSMKKHGNLKTRLAILKMA